MAESRFTPAEKLKAVERELGYRRRVYARRVGDGKMTPAQAEHEIAVFEEIRDEYAKREAAFRLL